MTFYGCNVLNVYPIKCVSMNNRESKIRPEITNMNCNKALFYPYSIQINKCSGNVLIILMIHVLNYVYLMLLKT